MNNMFHNQIIRQVLCHKYPMYLGVTLDRTLTFKEHLRKIKATLNTRNALLNKLTTSKWEVTANTLRTTALALSFSAEKYASHVWEDSTHIKTLDSALIETARKLTGCLKPTPIQKVYCLADIALPSIGRKIASQIEKRKQESDIRHPLHDHKPAIRRLKSRQSFLDRTTSLIGNARTARLKAWKQQNTNVDFCIEPNEHLTKRISGQLA